MVNVINHVAVLERSYDFAVTSLPVGLDTQTPPKGHFILSSWVHQQTAALNSDLNGVKCFHDRLRRQTRTLMATVHLKHQCASLGIPENVKPTS